MSRAFQCRSAAATHPGRVRQVNEDAFLDLPEAGLWAVADGMGGHAAGSLASSAVVRALGAASAQTFLGRSVIDLRERLHGANRQLRAEAERLGEPVIGSTVVALSAVRGHCAVLWVGDSRVYRLRAGELRRLTRDHSRVEELVELGLLARDSAESHPAANIVTRAVGAGEGLEVDAQIHEIKDGDRYLLCSDGLTKEVSERQLADLMAASAVSEIPQALVDRACLRGARDNVTAVVVEFLLAP